MYIGRFVLAAVCISLGATLMTTAPAGAQVPRKINYQGRLADYATGQPLPGSHIMTFSIYDQEVDGTSLWTETHSVVVDSGGVVSVILGTDTPLEISFDGPMWLEVGVDDEVLAPRREMVSVPFAFRALAADSAGAGHSLNAVDGDPVDVVYVDDQGRVDIVGRVAIAEDSDGAVIALEVKDNAYINAIQTVNFELTAAPATDHDILQLKTPPGSPPDFQFIECERGNSRVFHVNGDGWVYADSGFTTPASDFAEMIRVSAGSFTVEPGDVMVIDPSNPRAALRSSEVRSTLVAGVHSTAPGFVGSERKWSKPVPPGEEEGGVYTLLDMASEFNEIPMAVIGIVPCKVSAENGPISPGDLLVTSTTPGHAMRDDDPRVGTVLGKALESLDSGTGLIKVLVTLQ